MQISFLSILFIFLSSSAEIKRISEFGPNPGGLNMYLYEPAGIDSSRKNSLIFVLHGCTQSAKDVARLTGWNKLADLYGFYVVYPEQRLSNNLSLCFNWFMEKDVTGKGESGSIFSMYKYMMQNYRINPDSVFITGLSAGAAMSVVMMAVYPDKFNAGAIFAGVPYGIASSALKVASAITGTVSKSMAELKKLVTDQNPGYPGKYPRIIIFQGEDDPVVHRNCAVELIKQWAALWQSDTLPEKIETEFGNALDVTRYSYYDKNGTKFMTYYTGKNTGHVLYVDPGKCRNMGGEKGIYGKDQDIHSTWHAAMEMGLIPDQKIKITKENNKNSYILSVPSYNGSEYFWKIPSDWQFISSDSSGTVRVSAGKLPAIFTVVEKDSLDCFYEYKGSTED